MYAIARLRKDGSWRKVAGSECKRKKTVLHVLEVNANKAVALKWIRVR